MGWRRVEELGDVKDATWCSTANITNKDPNSALLIVNIFYSDVGDELVYIFM